MNTSLSFISLGISGVVIFGGVFTLRFIKNEELLLDQIIGFIICIIIFIISFGWRKYQKTIERQ